MNNASDPIGSLSGILRDSGQAWRKRSACADPDIDPDIFHSKGLETQKAKEVCSRCEVSQKCLNWALETQERFGIYGGMTARERKALLRKRKTATSTRIAARVASAASAA